MAMMERPAVSDCAGGRCWEHTFDSFNLKVYVPDNDLDGHREFSKICARDRDL